LTKQGGANENCIQNPKTERGFSLRCENKNFNNCSIALSILSLTGLWISEHPDDLARPQNILIPILFSLALLLLPLALSLATAFPLR